MPEGLSATEVGNEIAEHHDRADAQHERSHHDHHDARHSTRDRWISIVEALLLSIVALMAAWAGYSAAKWSTDASLSLARASAARTHAGLAEIESVQIRTLDSVSFNAAATAYTSHDRRLFALAVRRLRPGYRPAFEAWLATHPLRNPHAPPDPSYMPQYHIPQEAQGRRLDAQAVADATRGDSAAGTSDRYVRLTVLLAAVLFLVGLGSRFPVLIARYGLITVAAGLLVISLVQLLALPGPPS